MISNYEYRAYPCHRGTYTDGTGGRCVPPVEAHVIAIFYGTILCVYL